MAAGATRLDGRSRRGARLPRRSRGEWLVRGGLAVLMLLIGYHAVIFTLAGAIKRDPARAHALAPHDGRATGRLAAALGGPDADIADRRRAAVLAEAALRQDAVNPVAASALGLSAQAEGNDARARRAFAYAERLSRRDVVAQLWAIENAVAQGDIAGALRHYDIALRVKPEMGGLLFPILIAASDETEVRSELVRILAAQPAWQEPFVNFAAGNAAEVQRVATLFGQLRLAGVPIPPAASAALVDTLFSRGDIDRAWAYYAAIRSGASRNRSRDPRFAGRIEAPTRFDWTTVDGGGIVGAIEAGEFNFTAPSSVGGPMLQQVQLLSSGTYRLIGQSAGIDQPDRSLPYWVLTCADGRELGRVDVPRSGGAGGIFSGTVRVGPGCPIQTLTLVAKASEAVSGLEGRITRVELLPVR